MRTVTVCDGQRRIGEIIGKQNGFEVYDAEGAYLAKYETVGQARGALIQHDRDRRQGPGDRAA